MKAPNQTGVRGLTPEELRECRRLHVRLGRRVDAVFTGDYRSAVRGRGMEFEEVRGYVPGDDVRHIDWNVTARSQQAFIKIFREERQNTVLLVVDVSGSARTGSGGKDGITDRRRQIARVAGMLAYAGIRNRDRIGLVTFSDRIEAYLPPRPTAGHAWAVIAHAFASRANSRGTDLEGALGYVAKMQRRRATIVVISDFLADGNWSPVLSTLARRHEVHGIIVHDPLDLGFSGLGMMEVTDAETGESYLLDGPSWASQQGVRGRVQALERLGVRTLAMSTSDDAHHALHLHFQKVRGRR